MGADIPRIPSSEITPEAVYLSRRRFMAALGGVLVGVAVVGCGTRAAILRELGVDDRRRREGTRPSGENGPAGTSRTEGTRTPPTGAGSGVDELGDPANRFEDITNFNNFYEFTTDKVDVARLARGFVTSPWDVAIGGLVHAPMVLGMEDLLRRFPRQERVYRLRCVEGWSMVIPWQGFPLADLLKLVQPKTEARYVRFETLHDPDRMPGQRDRFYPWPYVEGLRLDEAMHPLTLMVTGLYGRDLLPQNGAPLRLAVPWKYGFKSIKSIVRIDLVAEKPRSLWMAAAPNEYGFFANVNPEVAHPRWSQSSERRIGEGGRRPTLMFNGYEDQVAALYAGMDLRANF
jgi:methionine sulfoxide reductase catalytic subunit